MNYVYTFRGMPMFRFLQIWFMGGIVVPKNKIPFTILVLISIAQFLNSVFAADILPYNQTRTID